MIIKNDLKQKTNFDFYYRKYEQAINKYARELSSEIGKPGDFEDYKQEGKIVLFNLYQKRLELINFEPEIYKYKDILIIAKKKGLIIDFNISDRKPYKNSKDFLIEATAFTKRNIRNFIKDFRKRSYSYDKKTILINDIDYIPSTNLKPNIRFKVYKALNLYNLNIFKILEDDIIQSIDIQNILETIKNQKTKKSFIYWGNFYNGSEISKMLGISKQAVYKKIDQIKKILNLYYYEHGIRESVAIYPKDIPGMIYLIGIMQDQGMKLGEIKTYLNLLDLDIKALKEIKEITKGDKRCRENILFEEGITPGIKAYIFKNVLLKLLKKLKITSLEKFNKIIELKAYAELDYKEITDLIIKNSKNLEAFNKIQKILEDPEIDINLDIPEIKVIYKEPINKEVVFKKDSLIEVINN
ncbi:MAG: hypothetical protein WBA71_05415 [Candidatus Humimicrobiia bacterium]